MKCLNKSCVSQADSDSNYCNEHKASPGKITRRVGGSSLKEICAVIEYIETSELAVLVDLTKQSGENLASFEKIAPSGEFVPQSFLIEVKPEGVSSLIAEQTAQGRRLMFTTTVLVDDKDKRVAVYR